ncbi:MAG: hypothetical protein IPP35_02935 [Elusimicrobia bacterium]|nr:hypothetical protein [Elusimicrobiota bacterium]
MNRSCLIYLATALVFAPGLVFGKSGQRKAFHEEQKAAREAHRKQQQGENEAFRGTLKGKSDQEKADAIKAHHEEQYNENMAFREEMHKKNTEFLKAHLASNDKLTDAQKNELIAHFENNIRKMFHFANSATTTTWPPLRKSPTIRI